MTTIKAARCLSKNPISFSEKFKLILTSSSVSHMSAAVCISFLSYHNKLCQYFIDSFPHVHCEMEFSVKALEHFKIVYGVLNKFFNFHIGNEICYHCYHMPIMTLSKMAWFYPGYYVLLRCNNILPLMWVRRMESSKCQAISEFWHTIAHLRHSSWCKVFLRQFYQIYQLYVTVFLSLLLTPRRDYFTHKMISSTATDTITKS